MQVLFLGFLHLLIDAGNCFFELLVSVGSESWHRNENYELDFSDIDSVFLELCQNNRHSILEPESLPFESDTSLKFFIVLDGILYFAS